MQTGISSVSLELLVQVLALAGVVLAYYGIGAGQITKYSARVVDYLQLAKQHPRWDVQSAVILALAGLAQCAFLAALIVLYHLDLGSLGITRVDPVLLGYGILLGIGEFSASSFLGQLAIQIATRFAPQRVPLSLKHWLIMARGGWMSPFIKMTEIARWHWAALWILLYAAVEEVIFRAVLITVMRPVGVAWALGGSVILFCAVQIFHMPSWRNAMFPVIGSLVIGILHGALFIAVPQVFPLVVAHIVMFVAILF